MRGVKPNTTKGTRPSIHFQNEITQWKNNFQDDWIIASLQELFTSEDFSRQNAIVASLGEYKGNEILILVDFLLIFINSSAAGQFLSSLFSTIRKFSNKVQSRTFTDMN
jgi:hypothetical protein